MTLGYLNYPIENMRFFVKKLTRLGASPMAVSQASHRVVRGLEIQCPWLPMTTE
jgi:hypothetical protein